MMRGCDTSSQDRDGYTAAHYAAARDDVEMLKALTIRFHCRVKTFSDDYINQMHQRGLQALRLTTNQGLTVFMLACYHQSMKCLNYLLDLNINDAQQQDQFGDTALHYAVARRNEDLVRKLLDQCQADVNGGSFGRPSALDLVQFIREEQPMFDRAKENAIEQLLLSRHARNRCPLRRNYSKRKLSVDQSATATATAVISPSIENSRVLARSALEAENRGHLDEAEKLYRQAMEGIPSSTLDRAICAYRVSMIRLVRGDYPSAHESINEALTIRRQFEEDSDELSQWERTLESIQKGLSDSIHLGIS